MSFARSYEEAHSICQMLQIDKEDGKSGGSSSPIRDGASHPGTAHDSAASKDMAQHRTALKTRTNSLTRKYAAS